MLIIINIQHFIILLQFLIQYKVLNHPQTQPQYEYLLE